MSKPHFLSADCPECGAAFDRVPVDYDEDGNPEIGMDATRCALETCGKTLCPCCETFSCDGCGHAFCLAHRVMVANGVYAPLECCPMCAAECEEVAPIPAQSERGRSANEEVA